MQKKLIIFQDRIAKLGGVETHLYNLSLVLKDYYDILVVYGSIDKEQLLRLAEIVETEKYDKNKTYKCDICIRNSLYWVVPDNIKANRYIEILHADYEWLSDKVIANEWDKAEKLGCGEFVSKQYKKVKKLDYDVPFIRNILKPKKDTEKIYHFISATRLGPEKGWNRMLKMCEMLRANNIKFVWDIFTNDDKAMHPEEMHFMKARYDIFDYIADADYLVQLSDAEGFPYAVQEALQYNTPVICTDIGGCTEIIKDGENGYVVPLNMDFDINKIKKIPKLKEYVGTTAQDWCDYLGGAEYINKKSRRKEFMKIQALKGYTDVELNKWIEKGEIYEVNKARGEYIIANNFAIKVEEPKKEKKLEKVPFEEKVEEEVVPYEEVEEVVAEKVTKKSKKKSK